MRPLYQEEIPLPAYQAITMRQPLEVSLVLPKLRMLRLYRGYRRCVYFISPLLKRLLP